MLVRALVILSVVMFFTTVETGAQQTSNEKSKKVYGVRELVQILNTKPNSLNGKIVRVEAFAVDGTKGMGCDSGIILIDKRDVSAYHGAWKGTPSETGKKLSAIPTLETGPVVGVPTRRNELSFPISVVPVLHAIYDGHFFDENSLACTLDHSRL